jgi:hypothetical protein
LGHLQFVIGAKLRRRESFFFWTVTPDVASGRSTIWLDSPVPLSFIFSGKMPALNRRWLEELSATANTSGGLRIVPEPEE